MISGNLIGVSLIGTGTTGNLLEGNYIGTSKSGFADLGNKDEGVFIEQGARKTRSVAARPIAAT